MVCELRGTGAGRVTREAFAEPYGGDLRGTPRFVILRLNPGQAQLDFQARDGIFANAIRAYCDAVEAEHGADAVAADAEAAEWLSYAGEQADQGQRLPRMPADPEPSAEDLKPFLGGLSPYGRGQRW
jgi:hypothetical protein